MLWYYNLPQLTLNVNNCIDSMDKIDSIYIRNDWYNGAWHDDMIGDQL